MSFGAIQNFTTPDYGRGILDVAPNVAPSNPSIMDYLDQYEARNEQFRIKPLDYSRYGEVPDPVAPYVPQGVAQPSQQTIPQVSFGEGGQDVSPPSNTTPQDFDLSGLLGDIGMPEIGIEMPDIGFDFDMNDVDLGGLLGDVIGQDIAASPEAKALGNPTARQVGKPLGMVSSFLATPAVVPEMLAGLVELRDYKDTLDKFGMKGLSLMDALAVGFDPTQDLRGATYASMRDQVRNKDLATKQAFANHMDQVTTQTIEDPDGWGLGANYGGGEGGGHGGAGGAQGNESGSAQGGGSAAGGGIGSF